jgi:hypothetical protein
MLNRVFGVMIHDTGGNPLAISPKGSLGARQLLANMPIWGAMVYSRFSFPADPIVQGSRWTSVRHPPSWAGELGVEFHLDYTLIGFDTLDGALTAVVEIQTEIHRAQYRISADTSVSGLTATVAGTAWVELETSRVHRLVLEDEIQLLITSKDASGAIVRSRVHQENRLTLELRDANRKPSTWADGARRLGRR